MKIIKHGFLKIRLFIIIMSSLILTSCQKDVIKGSGNIIEKNIPITGFHSVETHYDIQAILTHGTTTKVVASGYENIMDLLDFQVINGVLQLKFNTVYNRIKNANVVVQITMPQLKASKIHGSGNIEIRNFRKVGNIELGIFGSGNIILSNSVYSSANLRINGSGSIHGTGLQVNEAQVNIDGSGNSTIAVVDKLKATINGTGHVYYIGTPQLEVIQNGTGRVRPR